MTRAAAVTAYRLISGAVLAGAITLCVAAWHLGTERTGRATAYFYEVFDIGHPGIVNAVTSMALVAVATISVMLGPHSVAGQRRAVPRARRRQRVAPPQHRARG